MNKSFNMEYTVTPKDTAEALGSGALPVLATPTVVAWMENCALLLAAQQLESEDTTVGTHIDISHLKPSKLGAVIRVEANLKLIEGKKMSFDIACFDTTNDSCIARGTHDRAIVNAEKFMARLLNS